MNVPLVPFAYKTGVLCICLLVIIDIYQYPTPQHFYTMYCSRLGRAVVASTSHSEFRVDIIFGLRLLCEIDETPKKTNFFLGKRLIFS